MDQIKIGKFIARKRKEKNLTQEQFAEKLGVSNKTISRWENSTTMPDISLYKDICDVLGISIIELIEGEEISPEKRDDMYEKKMIELFGNMDLSKKRITRQYYICSILILVLEMIIIEISDKIMVIVLSILLWILASTFNTVFYIIAKDVGSIMYDLKK